MSDTLDELLCFVAQDAEFQFDIGYHKGFIVKSPYTLDIVSHYCLGHFHDSIIDARTETES